MLSISIVRSPRFFAFLTPVHRHRFRMKHEHCVQQNWRRPPIRCHFSLLCYFVYVFFTGSMKFVTDTDGVSRRYIWFTAAQGGWNRSFLTSIFIYHAAATPCGPRRPHYGGFTIALRHTSLSRTPLDEWSARRGDLYLTTHNTYNRETSMSPAGFGPTIPASERPQTHASDRAATGTGMT
jgi:hypothetical protein